MNSLFGVLLPNMVEFYLANLLLVVVVVGVALLILLLLMKLLALEKVLRFLFFGVLLLLFSSFEVGVWD